MANRLAGATSPYLLQHADNPVNWWPWGSEAFEEARRRDVPIFLSVGYSTCYWCHVMAHECFEDTEIAGLLNEYFVPIKVDREERPDIDEIYMTAIIIMRGHGGWPMSVFLEPRLLRPFYCGTYFPPEARHGLPGFPDVLRSIAQAWESQREGVEAQAGELARAVEQHLGQCSRAELTRDQIVDAVTHLLRTFDRVHGGFGGAPKFPQPALLEFLMDVRWRVEDDASRDAIDIAVRRTLDAMTLGGIRDHLGGGFHRYAVDERWSVPHFEKMLYDNAGLLALFARAAREYGDAEYARTAHDIVRYVGSRLTDSSGVFHSAEDAATQGREGATYLWTPDEVRAALCPPELDSVPDLSAAGREAAAFAIRVFALDGPPNFRDPHHPDEPAKWVLRLADSPERLARAMQMPPDDFIARLERVEAALLEARDRRPQPFRDEKVIAAWNGMMISALARASRDLNAPAYLAMAGRAMGAVLAGMRDDAGDLLRVKRGSRVGGRGLLEDYAWVVQALFDLARAAPVPARSPHVLDAVSLLDRAERAFFEADGRIFDTRAAENDLFVRACSLHDGATACAFSVMVNALIDATEVTGDPRYRQRAAVALEAVGGRLVASPAGAVNSMRALLRLLIASENGPGPGRPVSATEAHRARAVDAHRRLPANTPAVQVYAGVDHVTVEPDHPAELDLLVRIEEGWHVPAADPGNAPGAANLIPFRIDIAGGSGVRAYADYPPGAVMGEGDLAIRVYEGEFRLRVALEHAGARRGHPRLVVRYQPCTMTRCEQPVAAELDVAILGN